MHGEDSPSCIIWNAAKFQYFGHTRSKYNNDILGATTIIENPIIFLKDRANGTKIALANAHLKGFNLSAKDDNAPRGDYQLQADLETLSMVPTTIDLFVYAGDFNASREHYPQRMHPLADQRYQTDLIDQDPTIYDLNLRGQNNSAVAVKLDHIYAKGRNGADVRVSKVAVTNVPVNYFDSRASDHLPIGSNITISYRP